MNNYKNILIISLIMVFFQACSIKDKMNNLITPKTTNKTTVSKNLSLYKTTNKFEGVNVSEKLIAHYKQWKGVKYKYGGNNKKGIDCSYLVQDVFTNKLNFKMPRTTREQRKIGIKINKSQLEVGDLVFFYKGRKANSHVGIYLGYNDFMHVSTSRGLMISSLNNSYWKKNYNHSRKVLKL